jgi:tetratricopeptide (TPR) repeat protein
VMDVAAQLGDQVERVEIEKALAKPGDLTAWEAVMRSFAGIANYDFESLRISAIEARKALAIAPGYALGHAALADALGGLYSRGGGGDLALVREARSHADRALAVGSNDALILGWVGIALCSCGAWPEAQRIARRAMELNPNLAIVRLFLAQLYIRLKRPDDALMHADAVLSLAPRGYMTHLALAYRGLSHYQSGRYEQSLQAMEQALLVNPGFVYPQRDIAVVHEKLERHEEARDAVCQLRLSNPSIKLEDLEAFTRASLFPPDLAEEFNMIFRKVWMDTPMDSGTI